MDVLSKIIVEIARLIEFSKETKEKLTESKKE